jgi:hypothetical protein
MPGNAFMMSVDQQSFLVGSNSKIARPLPPRGTRGMGAFGLISRFNVRRRNKLVTRVDHISLYWDQAYDIFRLFSLVERRPTRFSTDYPYPLVPFLPFQRTVLGDTSFELPSSKVISAPKDELTFLHTTEPNADSPAFDVQDPEPESEGPLYLDDSDSPRLPSVGSSRRGRRDSKTMYRVLFTTSFNTEQSTFLKIQDRYRIAVARTAGCDLSVVRVVSLRDATWDFGTKISIQVETEVMAYGRLAATTIAERLNLLDFALVLQQQGLPAADYSKPPNIAPILTPAPTCATPDPGFAAPAASKPAGRPAGRPAVPVARPFAPLAIGDRVRIRTPNPHHGRFGIVVEIFDKGLTGLPKVRIRLADGDTDHFSANHVDLHQGSPDGSAADIPLSAAASDYGGGDSELPSPPPGVRLPKIPPTRARPARGKRGVVTHTSPKGRTALPHISASRAVTARVPPPAPASESTESDSDSDASQSSGSGGSSAPPAGGGAGAPAHIPSGSALARGAGGHGTLGRGASDLKLMAAFAESTAAGAAAEASQVLEAIGRAALIFDVSFSRMFPSAGSPLAGSPPRSPARRNAQAAKQGDAPALKARPPRSGGGKGPGPESAPRAARGISPRAGRAGLAMVHVYDVGDLDALGEEETLWRTAAGRHPRAAHNRLRSAQRLHWREDGPSPPAEPLQVRGDGASPRHRFIILRRREGVGGALFFCKRSDTAAAACSGPPVRGVSEGTQTDPPLASLSPGHGSIGAALASESGVSAWRGVGSCEVESAAADLDDGEGSWSESDSACRLWAPPPMVLSPPPWAIVRC